MAEKVPLESINSSNLSALGYNPLKKILAVQFKNGKVIHYSDVPLETVQQVYLSPSRGRAYHQIVRGKFHGELMTGECDKCGAQGWGGDACEECGCGICVVPERKAAANG